MGAIIASFFLGFQHTFFENITKHSWLSALQSKCAKIKRDKEISYILLIIEGSLFLILSAIPLDNSPLYLISQICLLVPFLGFILGVIELLPMRP